MRAATAALALALALAACRGPGAGAPESARGESPGVYLFVLGDCPIANAYAPEIRRIRDRYAPRGVEFTLVYVDGGISREEAAAHAAEYGLAMRIVLGAAARDLVARTGVTVSPEAAVILPAGEIAYRGRIDDRYADLFVARPEPTTRDLRAALDAILDGRPVPVARTAAIGCLVPDPPPRAIER